ncbi:MAG: hypothetical protein F4Y50_06840 [Dehalococcoidia bacterium]|nr:hypothetical protein [Dehalococcoidia bacterium]MYJ77612.1 hypothetical protein [Caldilineaceae bacterium SB0670_bin_27]
MTEAEEQSLAVFLQGLAIAVVNLLDQASPEDRTVEHFQQSLNGYLGVLLAQPETDTELCRPGVEELRQVLYREIARVQALHQES